MGKLAIIHTTTATVEPLRALAEELLPGCRVINFVDDSILPQLAENGGEIRKLFNTSGVDYREQKLGEKLPKLTETAALELLATNGNLVKRPFLIGESVALVGFDPSTWESRLSLSK